MNVATATIPHVTTLPAQDDDRELAARFAAGETLALEQAIERYGNRVASLATRLLGWRSGADDVVQEVFLAALRNQRRFRAESSLWTWLATITVNHCRSWQRRRWLFDRFLTATGQGRTERVQPPVDRAQRDETAVQVRDAVARLPAKYREVIVLRYLEEMAIADIAELLQLQRNAVEVRLSRAKRLLESALAEFARGER
jgi:RNA polymerase sigma-70 factor (ECF subfamily)